MNWINTKDRLPDKEGQVIAYDGSTVEAVYFTTYSDGTTYFLEIRMFDDAAFHAKYWMPLPEKPNNNGV